MWRNTVLRSGVTILVLTALLTGRVLAENGPPSAPVAGAGAERELEAGKERAEFEAREGAAERALRRSELYADGDYRIARPGQHPVSNFYSVGGFRTVDPRCYAGTLSWETQSWIPLGGEAKFHVFEQIRLRPTRSANRFVQRHRWEIFSDPLEIMGVVSTSQGSGGGTARVSLALDMEHGIYRLVSDVRPRLGPYQISSAGGGLARSKTEEFHFYLADHHYSYVNLSGLQAARGTAAGQSALESIDRILANRPPNVFMGYFDWARNESGVSEGELQIDDEEHMRLGWGVKIEGQRGISIRIFCDSVTGQYAARWGRD